jgi:hypothetical protein
LNWTSFHHNHGMIMHFFTNTNVQFGFRQSCVSPSQPWSCQHWLVDMIQVNSKMKTKLKSWSTRILSMIMDWIHCSFMVHTRHDHVMITKDHSFSLCHDHCSIIVNMVTCWENKVAGYEIIT